MFLSIGLILFFLFVLPEKTYAYLDPGNGSYLLQVALGMLFGALASIKVFSKEITSFITKIRPQKESTEEQ
jgi:hypothetical protein